MFTNDKQDALSSQRPRCSLLLLIFVVIKFDAFNDICIIALFPVTKTYGLDHSASSQYTE